MFYFSGNEMGQKGGRLRTQIQKSEQYGIDRGRCGQMKETNFHEMVSMNTNTATFNLNPI